ncbi:MAG: Holliday junction branch migration protein RuvA [Desulfatiglans sp.]|jgi:Holliday junction DNA helicase RuvA|nr:Holliday junction branch migration protein RuvA [Thermodesulfobacteriota bacterium]MEE4352972.1 Holliday junction branch migration protein RuvA [Desulfatiglans sp.]
MIAYLSGQLFAKSTQSIIINTGGIGYEVFVPLSTFYALPEIGENANLYIHTHVREDALFLFGFQTRLEKDLFLMLISVSGIGPKLSINILSGIGPEELLGAIASGDAVALQSIPGIGKKTAERIALELKDRACQVSERHEVSPPDVPDMEEKDLIEDALSALLNLGYSAKSAKGAIDKVRSVERPLSLEMLIRESLKKLA